MKPSKLATGSLLAKSFMAPKVRSTGLVQSNKAKSESRAGSQSLHFLSELRAAYEANLDKLLSFDTMSAKASGSAFQRARALQMENSEEEDGEAEDCEDNKSPCACAAARSRGCAWSGIEQQCIPSNSARGGKRGGYDTSCFECQAQPACSNAKLWERLSV